MTYKVDTKLYKNSLVGNRLAGDSLTFEAFHTQTGHNHLPGCY